MCAGVEGASTASCGFWTKLFCLYVQLPLSWRHCSPLLVISGVIFSGADGAEKCHSFLPGFCYSLSLFHQRAGRPTNRAKPDR